MSTLNELEIKGNINKDNSIPSLNKTDSSKNDEEKNHKTGNKNNRSNKFIYILVIFLLIAMIISAAIAIPLNNKKKNPKIEDNMQNEEEGQNKGEDQNDEEVPLDVNKNNYAKTKAYENFIIPPDGKLQVVGENFQQKNSTIIVGKNNKTFSIDDN